MTTSEKLTEVDLHDLLLAAAETERRLPPAMRKARNSWWPDTIPEWLSYPDEQVYVRLGAATNEQVTAYDLAIRIVTAQPDESHRQLLWAVAHSGAFRARGPAWRKIARLRHCDRRTVKRVYHQALADTVRTWNNLCSRDASAS